MGSGVLIRSNSSDEMPETVTMAQCALWLGVSRTTINRYIAEEGFPKPFFLSIRRKIFVKSDVLTWFNNRRSP